MRYVGILAKANPEKYFRVFCFPYLFSSVIGSTLILSGCNSQPATTKGAKMTTEQILNTIELVLGGRKIVGRVGLINNGKDCELWAYVQNADGIGYKHTLLMSTPDKTVAVTIRRKLNFANATH